MANSMAIDCPECSNKATFYETTHNVPNFGKIVITTIVCSHCSFRYTDVLNVESSKKAKKFKAIIEKPEDLNIKVIRSSSSTIKIEELGLEVNPGSISEGYYSNIEGILERFENAINAIETNDKKTLNEINKRLEQIKKAKNSKIKFTVILEDPYGNSALVGKKVKELK